MANISKKILGTLVGLGVGHEYLNTSCRIQLELISEIVDEKGGIDDHLFTAGLLRKYFSRTFDPDFTLEYLNILSDHPEALINPRAVAGQIPINDASNMFRQLIFIVSGPGRFDRIVKMAKLSHVNKDVANCSLILVEIFRFIIGNQGGLVSQNYKNIIPKIAPHIETTEGFNYFMREFECTYPRNINNMYDFLLILIFMHDAYFARQPQITNEEINKLYISSDQFPLFHALVGAVLGYDRLMELVEVEPSYVRGLKNIIARLA